MNNNSNTVAVVSKRVAGLANDLKPRGHKYEAIEEIENHNELNDLHHVENDFIMIAGMSPEEARQASINVGKYDFL